MSRLIQLRKRAVFVDSTDSSISLSARLFREMGGEDALGRKMLLFALREKNTYGFCFLPDDATPEAREVAPTLQVAQDGQAVGFECLTPTTAAILYRYGIDQPTAVLKVKRQQIHQTSYYEILPPSK